MKIRTGFGYDVHRLEIGEDLWVGGVKIDHTKGAVGHSDADVLLHVICDALLGAANLRDIGFRFPDSDDRYKDIDSKILLKRTIDLLTSKGYTIINIDSTVCLQAPTISTFIPEMQKKISEVTNIDIEDISIKATTTEKLGFIGNEEGISAFAVVLIEKP